MVNSNDIYFDVWKEILINYNIYLTQELFQKYIHGISDYKVVNTLIPNENLNNISTLKDKKFINSINKLKIIDGYVVTNWQKILKIIFKISKKNYQIII